MPRWKRSPRKRPGIISWKPFIGCQFACSYCEPYRRTALSRFNCYRCATYVPHWHAERLCKEKIPGGERLILLTAFGELAFADRDGLSRLFGLLQQRPQYSFIIQTKAPAFLSSFGQLPPNLIIDLTLETNRDFGYDAISSAPPPSIRLQQFKELHYPIKWISIEPVLDFDLWGLLEMIDAIKPQRVRIGLNSKPKAIALPEPSMQKLHYLIEEVKKQHCDLSLGRVRRK